MLIHPRTALPHGASPQRDFAQQERLTVETPRFYHGWGQDSPENFQPNFNPPGLIVRHCFDCGCALSSAKTIPDSDQDVHTLFPPAAMSSFIDYSISFINFSGRLKGFPATGDDCTHIMISARHARPQGHSSSEAAAPSLQCGAEAAAPSLWCEAEVAAPSSQH